MNLACHLSVLGHGPGQSVALCTSWGLLRAWLFPGAERAPEVGKNTGLVAVEYLHICVITWHLG